MKATSSSVMIVFLGLVSCFNPPEYPSVPEIEFNGINFVERSKPGDSDTLKLSIRFKDGDGDIGLLNDTNSDDVQFAERFYFKINDTGKKYVLRNGGTTQDIANDPSFVRYKTRRSNSNYDTLPGFTVPYTCTNWEIVKKEGVGTQPTVTIDTVYSQLNPNFTNIFVDFLVQKNDNSGEFEKFDFYNEGLCLTFDGRIPILAKEAGQETPLQGVINYNMISAGFKTIFSIKTLKLRVRIQDRALNKSNTITSDAFTIAGVTSK